MCLTTRIILILALMLPLACGAFAQEETSTATTAETTTAEAISTAATDTTTATTTAEESRRAVNESSYDTRSRFSAELRKHPPEVASILVLDPTLMSNEAYMSGYPRLQRFIADHPEVVRQARFYLAEFSAPQRGGFWFDELMEVIGIVAIWIFMAFALGWFIRTLIEQRRWKQLSKTQSEVHNKILDRFGSNEEVLAYIKTPAGSKFLESAPIPLHTEKPAPSNPYTKVIWSVQLGVVLLAAAVGLLLVSIPFEGDSAHSMFALGAIAFSVGAGFIASALVSITLSRRLGLWPGPAAAPNSSDEPELMR